MAMMMRMKNSFFFFNSFAITVKKKINKHHFIYFPHLPFLFMQDELWHHFVLITSYFDARHALFYIYTTSMQ